MNTAETLGPKQKGIVTIAAFTAIGDLEKLKPALQQGLNSGLTVNEIKEVLIQMYAYAGFPRSLNGINTLMAVMDERQAQGIDDEMGSDASPLPADMNRDEYGANVRAKLAGQEKIPRQAAISSLHQSSIHFSKNTYLPTSSHAMSWMRRPENWLPLPR